MRSAPEALLHSLKMFFQLAPARRILAVSGGLDSMVLLEGALRLCEQNSQERKSLLVVHVNHGLRGAESEGDERLVVDRANEAGVKVEVFHLKPGGKFSQAQSRQAREEIYCSLMSDPRDRIFFAHHLNDQAETVMLRIVRGTGAKGLGGMKPINGRKFRPFLEFPKSALREAAQAWKIEWREDSSNQSSRYERNWLRLDVMPLLEARRPGIAERLAGMAKGFRELQSQKEEAWDSFSLNSKISFARPKRGLSTLELRERFTLSRKHSESLKELLAKPAGKFHAEGIRFSWSAGILLAEREETFLSTLEIQGGPAPRAMSVLGDWRFSALPAERIFSLRGDKVKKEFQELRVPTFFRSAIPLWRVQGRAVALLPERMGRLQIFDQVRYKPSELAAWWLSPNAFESPSDPAV